MAPPPRRTNDRIGTRAAVKSAAGRMRVHPQDKLDVLAGALDADASIVADNLDTAPLLDFVPLERAGMKRSEDDVRIVRVELALVPAHDEFLARLGSRGSGSGSGSGSGDGGYVNTKRSRKLVIRTSPSSSSSQSAATGDESTAIALGDPTPHPAGIRVPQTGREKRIGDDDSERGAPVEGERARWDGER